MIKKKEEKQGKWWLLAVLSVLIIIFAGRITSKVILAYQTDSEVVENRFTPGHNTTIIEEEFPEQTLKPGESKDIVKKVWILNEKDEHNVPCYIRAKISFSTEDFGSYTVLGTNSKWKLCEDGFYYYTEKVPVGGTTECLLTGVRVDGSKANGSAAETGPLEIYIYEESCQVKNPDTQKDRTWKEAWEHALSRTIE